MQEIPISIRKRGHALTAGKKWKVRRGGHEKDRGEAQPEINLHRECGHLSELHRLGWHGSSLRNGSSCPCDQALLASPGDAPDVKKQNGPQPAPDCNRERAVAYA